MPASQLPPLYLSLSRKTDHWFARADAALLSQIPCRTGCAHCCIGPFPITMLDVHFVREGLFRLPTDIRERIEHRAREQILAMESAFPTLSRSRHIDDWSDHEIDRLVTEFQHCPCPALEENLCSIYDFRPLTCRSMGIPIEQEGVTQGACEVQVSVPIVRLSLTQRAEEDELAQMEAKSLAQYRTSTGAEDEEVLLPYGFIAPELP